MSSEIAVPAGLATDGLLGRRYLSRIIDSVAIILVFRLLVLVWSVTATGAVPNLVAKIVFPALLFLMWIGYGAVLDSSEARATIGKRLLGLRVCNSQGGRLTLLQAAVRNLIKDGPFLLLALIPGTQLLVLAWLAAHIVVMHRSAAYQAIHDHAARTWVAARKETIQLRIV